MEKIMVSACLTGECVRYDGLAAPCSNPTLKRWIKEGRITPFCPEVTGGMTVPRRPAEIIAGDGQDVLSGNAAVLNSSGRDVTHHFIAGAKIALETALACGIKIAILKDGSPSCGSNYIYNGSFSGNRKPGQGVTAALLKNSTIQVFCETEIKTLQKEWGLCL